MDTNALTFMKMYKDLQEGRLVIPRGLKIKEKEDYRLVLDMEHSPCTNFAARKMNLGYAKAEMWWYLRGDKFDRSIDAKASMWPKLVQGNGSYFSNYGQYIFGEGQFDWVVSELCRDPESRRASITLLRPEHMFAANKDVVCTYGINFRIRNDRLNMTVHMRSNDAIFGTTNDVFAFSCLYRMVWAAMKYTNHPTISPGTYTHLVDSLHVYEKHWDMLNKIIDQGMDAYSLTDVPYPNSVHDLAFLMHMHTLGYREPPKEFALSRFLYEQS